MNDIMQYTIQRQIHVLFILINFENAFGIISWKFIYQTLDFFHFGILIKIGFKTFYKIFKFCGMQNEFTSH